VREGRGFVCLLEGVERRRGKRGFWQVTVI
jgi:hypothetical protein